MSHVLNVHRLGLTCLSNHLQALTSARPRRSADWSTASLAMSSRSGGGGGGGRSSNHSSPGRPSLRPGSRGSSPPPTRSGKQRQTSESSTSSDHTSKGQYTDATLQNYIHFAETFGSRLLLRLKAAVLKRCSKSKCVPLKFQFVVEIVMRNLFILLCT